MAIYNKIFFSYTSTSIFDLRNYNTLAPTWVFFYPIIFLIVRTFIGSNKTWHSLSCILWNVTNALHFFKCSNISEIEYNIFLENISYMIRFWDFCLLSTRMLLCCIHYISDSHIHIFRHLRSSLLEKSV